MPGISSFLCWVEVSNLKASGNGKDYFVITEKDILSDQWFVAMKKVKRRHPFLYRNMRKIRLFLEGREKNAQFQGVGLDMFELPLEGTAIRAYHGLRNKGVRRYEHLWWCYIYPDRLPQPLDEKLAHFDQFWGRLWDGGYFSIEMLTQIICHPSTVDWQIKAARQLLRQKFLGDDDLRCLVDMVEPLGENERFYYNRSKSRLLRSLLVELALKHRWASDQLIELLMESDITNRDRLRLTKRLFRKRDPNSIELVSKYGSEPYRGRATKLLSNP